jgi:organic hydroperoxide reductase OsmC/OhrA
VHRDGLISGTNSNTLEGRVDVGEHATNPEEILGAVDGRCVTMSLVNLRTEKDCPISRTLSGVEITLEASLAAG